MKLEKIFERPDGSKVKLSVGLWLNSYQMCCDYPLQLFYWKKGGRSWIHLDFDGYDYLKLNPDERKAYELKEILKFVTVQEVMQTKMELWELLKPTF